MKKRNLFLSLICIIGLFFSLAGYAFATEQSMAEQQSMSALTSMDEQDMARSIALVHISSDMYLKEQNNDSDTFTAGKLGEMTPIYNQDENVNGYIIELETPSGEENGYVVVGVDPNYAAIIEFAYEGSPLTLKKVEALQQEYGFDNYKIYFLGDVNYQIRFQDGNQERLFDITNEPIEITDMAAIPMNMALSTEDFSSEWENFAAIIAPETMTRSSNPPEAPGEGDYPIYNPLDYESGYTSVDAKTVPGWNLTYYLMDEFDGESHCGATCATNMLYWWYYNGFDGVSDGTFSGTTIFNTLYNGMGSNVSYGTYNSKLKAYVKAQGLSCTTGTLGSYSSLKTEMSNGRPVTILVQNHPWYGNHYVLGVGYTQCNYKSGTSNYARIVDGWDEFEANRFTRLTGVNFYLYCRISK